MSLSYLQNIQYLILKLSIESKVKVYPFKLYSKLDDVFEDLLSHFIKNNGNTNISINFSLEFPFLLVHIIKIILL